MSGYLTHLVERTLGLVPLLEPRQRSRFEPTPESPVDQALDMVEDAPPAPARRLPAADRYPTAAAVPTPGEQASAATVRRVRPRQPQRAEATSSHASHAVERPIALADDPRSTGGGSANGGATERPLELERTWSDTAGVPLRASGLEAPRAPQRAAEPAGPHPPPEPAHPARPGWPQAPGGAQSGIAPSEHQMGTSSRSGTAAPPGAHLRELAATSSGSLATQTSLVPDASTASRPDASTASWPGSAAPAGSPRGADDADVAVHELRRTVRDAVRAVLPPPAQRDALPRVTVTIGRVVVREPPPPLLPLPEPAPAPAPGRKPLSLDEYLSRREGGSP